MSVCLLATLRKNYTTDLLEIVTTNVTFNKEVPGSGVWIWSFYELHIRTPEPDQILLGGGMRSLYALVLDINKVHIVAVSSANKAMYVAVSCHLGAVLLSQHGKRRTAAKAMWLVTQTDIVNWHI